MKSNFQLVKLNLVLLNSSLRFHCVYPTALMPIRFKTVRPCLLKTNLPNTDEVEEVVLVSTLTVSGSVFFFLTIFLLTLIMPFSTIRSTI